MNYVEFTYTNRENGPSKPIKTKNDKFEIRKKDRIQDLCMVFLNSFYRSDDVRHCRKRYKSLAPDACEAIPIVVARPNNRPGPQQRALSGYILANNANGNRIN